jgi:uncharacterized protein
MTKSTQSDESIFQLTTVLVGSRLHGLNNELSDYDWRGVHIHPLKAILSPFSKHKDTVWIEDDEDNTSYELADFCKQAVHGNATILEVFFSDQVKNTTPAAEIMRANWQKFIDTDAFVMSSRGYAQNQYNKMQLFSPDARTPKFAVAYLRVLWQCEYFLKNNRFSCQISDKDTRDFLMKVKYEFSEALIPELTERFMNMQRQVTDAYKTATIMKPDIAWIESFIHDTYTQQTSL